MTFPPVQRRAFLGLLSGAAVASCTSFKGSPFWGTLGAGINRGGAGASAITRDYADQLRYASMLTWFDGSPKALLVLGDVLPNGRLVWYSAERQTLTTYGAFVVGALGFDRELRSVSFQGEWLPNPLSMVGRRVGRVSDLSIDGKRHQVALESRFGTAGGAEELEIVDRTYKLARVTEEVRHERRVRYTNEYWVDPTDGRCWKSRQTIVPTVPPLNVEILKYPKM